MGLLDEISQGYNYVNDHLSKTMNSPLFALGMGMLNGGTGLNNVGNGIMQARSQQLQQIGQQQQIGMNGMQMQMMQQQMPYIQQLLAQLAQENGGGAAPSSGGAAPAGPIAAATAPSAPGGLLGAGAQPSGAVTSPLPGAPGPAPGAPPTAGAQPGGLLGGQPQQPQPQQMAPPGASADADSRRAAIMRQFNTGIAFSLMPMTAEGGKGLIQKATFMAANDPVLKTQMAAAGNEFSQMQAQVQDALSRGDAQTAKALQLAWMGKAGLINVSRNGTVTTLGGPPLDQLGISSMSPEGGTITTPTSQTRIPGALENRAAFAGAETGARESAEAPYDLVPVVGQDNKTYMVPKSVLLGQGGGGAGGAAGAGSVSGGPPGGGIVSKLSPEAVAQQSAAGSDAGKALGELNDAADAARKSNYALDNLNVLGHSATLGPTAGAREWFEQVATPLAGLFGVQPPKELGTYEQINKFGNVLGFAMARQMGSREAAQIVTLAIQSNPNKGLVPDAYYGLIDSMKAMGNYTIAKNNAVQAASTGGKVGARDAIASWETNIDPRVWDLAISPELANRFSNQIGVPKIAKALPFMESSDAVNVLRNVPASMQASILSKVDPRAKAQILAELQAPRTTGASGYY